MQKRRPFEPFAPSSFFISASFGGIVLSLSFFLPPLSVRLFVSLCAAKTISQPFWISSSLFRFRAEQSIGTEWVWNDSTPQNGFCAEQGNYVCVCACARAFKNIQNHQLLFISSPYSIRRSWALWVSRNFQEILTSRRGFFGTAAVAAKLLGS